MAQIQEARHQEESPDSKDREGKQAEDDGGAEAFHEREHVQI